MVHLKETHTMTQNRLPEFNDPNAKSRRKFHNTFNGYVIEVLYGARDAEGKPVAPKDGENDGHGRWYGIETEGNYTMFSWQKPADEGGETEYGTEYKDDALSVMKENILEKLQLTREAEEIGRNYEGEDGEERLAAILEKWNAMKNWETPKEAEYLARYERAKTKFLDRISDVRENRKYKEEIIERAKALADSTNWREIQNEFDYLREELGMIGSAGEDTDSRIRHEFHKLQDEFRDRRKAYYNNLDSLRAEAKDKKEALIGEAEKLVKNVTNWKNAGKQMNELFNRWKEAGHAEREIDDALWERFNSLRKEFNAGRQAFFDERNAGFRKSVEAKTALIEKAKEIAAQKVFSKENTDAMKKLDLDWKAAGYSGKDDNDRLWDEFTAAKNVFWDGKHEEAVKRFKDAAERKQADADKLKKEIEDLEFKITITPKPEMKREIERDTDAKKKQLEAVEKDIADLKKKIEG